MPSHSIVTKVAIGPEAVSRNQSRAAPCSAKALSARRKNRSIRSSMKRALPISELRWSARKSPSRASMSAGALTDET